jgi:hypothetical protein
MFHIQPRRQSAAAPGKPYRPAILMDARLLRHTVQPVKLRVLKHSAPAPSVGIILGSVALQLLLERYIKPLARLLRTPLVLWVLSASYAGLGVHAVELGSWLLIDGRVIRRSSLTAVLEASRPDVVSPRRTRVFISTTSGLRIPVRVDAQELAAFLGLAVRPLEL